MLVKWKSSYSVKVKEIDSQHKRIFQIINKLHEGIQKKGLKNIIKEILDELLDYSIYHFETEERYFDMYNYELTDEHKKEHESFKKKINEFITKYKKEEISVSFELIDFLEDWIINHVTYSDRKYIKCFEENGLT